MKHQQMHMYVCIKSVSWLNWHQKADPATLHLSASEQHSSRFNLESRFSTSGECESSVPLFKMPQGNVSCGFKVPQRIPSPLCFEWIKKKKKHPFLWLCLLICFYDCHAKCLGFEQYLVSSLRKSLRWLVLWWQQKNYLYSTFCQLTVRRAHKQNHLAIISCQSPIHPAKRMYSKKNGRQWKWSIIGQVGRGARREGWRIGERGGY